MSIESIILWLVGLVSSVSVFLLGLRIQQDAKDRDKVIQERSMSQEPASSVSASSDLAAKVHTTYISREERVEQPV